MSHAVVIPLPDARELVLNGPVEEIEHLSSAEKHLLVASDERGFLFFPTTRNIPPAQVLDAVVQMCAKGYVVRAESGDLSRPFLLTDAGKKLKHLLSEFSGTGVEES